MKKKSARAREFKSGFVVAIDGPSGAGKSTVSRMLAEALGGMLLDTGGMYRSVGYFALKEGIKGATNLGALARKLEFDVDRETKVLLVNGQDMGTKIRTQEVSEYASSVSRFRTVRTALTSKQRKLGNKWAKVFPVVVEGRDIGTIVFPKVPFKFYVTASAEVRAQRRLAQLKKQGFKGSSLKTVQKENEDRDLQDSTRKIAPLKVPEDAVIVDTSSMSISQVVQFMHDHIRNRLTLPNIEK